MHINALAKPKPDRSWGNGKCDTIGWIAAKKLSMSTSRRPRHKEQQEYDGIESKIQILEARKDELNAKLVAGDIFRTDPAQARAMTEEIPQLEKKIEKMYARWQELSELTPM